METQPIKPEYESVRDACLYMESDGGTMKYNQSKVNNCIKTHDEIIDKVGGGDDSQQAQIDIISACNRYCVYTNNPINPYGFDKSPFCYPQCILAGNIIAGQASKYPEEAKEIYSQFNALSEKDKILALSKLADDAKSYVASHPIRQREQFKPYSNSNSTRVIIIIILSVAILLFLITRD